MVIEGGNPGTKSGLQAIRAFHSYSPAGFVPARSQPAIALICRSPGPRDPQLRRARICYDHLAGEMGTMMFESMLARGDLARAGKGITLTGTGQDFVRDFLPAGLAEGLAGHSRAPLCRECLDWSERRSHLAGRLGRAMLARMIELGWAQRQADSRVIRFSADGESRFQAMFSA